MSSIYCFSEFLGSIAAVYISKYVSMRYIALFNIVSSIVSLLVLVPLGKIGNLPLRYTLTLLPVLLGGLSGSVYYACLLSYSSTLHPLYTQAVCLGLGIISVVIQLVEDVITAVYHVDESSSGYDASLIKNALTYYIVACVLVTSCLFAELWMERLTRYHFVRARPAVQVVSTTAETGVDQEGSTDYLVGDIVAAGEGAQVTRPAHPAAATHSSDRVIVGRLLGLGLASTFALGTYTLFFPLFFLCVPCYSCNSLDRGSFTLLVLTIFMVSDCLGRLLPMVRGLV